jgi:DNA polymerase/3'-5' exonuclease PolX
LKRIERKTIDKLHTKLSKLFDKMFPTLKWTICGSYRRGKPDSGDVDMLVTQRENKYELCVIIECMKKYGIIVDDLTEKGETKYMGMCRITSSTGFHRIDIRMINFECYYPALLYFTGSMELNTQMRTVAERKGYKLNEYHLIRLNDNVHMPINSEKDIFDYLNLKYLEPTERG